MDHSIDRYYEELFTLPFEDTREDSLEALRDKDIKHYRMKTIKSGEMLECEIYPIWNTSKSKEVKKAKEESLTRPEQKNLNAKNVRKKIVRILNGNFTDKDIWITTGYRDGTLPPTAEQARKDVVNYIRRLQRRCEKMGYPKLKYVYVTEFSEDTRVHHHIVTNFPDRDIAEKLWEKGQYPQARRLKPNDYGLEGLARYIAKDPKGSKSYGYSLNLYKSWEKPHVRTADSRMTRKKAEKLAAEQVDPQSWFESVYRGYYFKDMEVLRSDYVSGCYLYVRMKKYAEPKKPKAKQKPKHKKE